MQKKIIIIFAFLLASSGLFAQDFSYIFGKVLNENGKPQIDVNVVVVGEVAGAITNSKGEFELKVKSNESFSIAASYVGCNIIKRKVEPLSKGQRLEVNFKLELNETKLPEATVSAKNDATTNYQSIDPRVVSNIPVASGNGVEGILKTLPGVHSNNELSSQYSVRGGNFDENLVYVNDVEIYRPFLIRSGQQEGLSFLNSDMVSSISFSAGGFEAKYGDKISSVLDVKYRRPIEFASTVSLSMLGGGIQVEDLIAKGRLSYIIGVRNKTNQYVLKKLETKGDYKPSFTDVQTAWIYDLNSKLEISFLGSYAKNKYLVIPEDRTTTFGTLNEALQLKVYFDGQEVDEFSNMMGAVTVNYDYSKKLRLKFITSIFNSQESETYDIEGAYRLDELEVDFGKESFGNVAFNRGAGSYLNHARNYLYSTITNIEQKGYYSWNKTDLLQWGLKLQHEYIYDKMSEWNLTDSSDYTLPITPDSVGYVDPNAQPDYSLEMQDVVRSSNTIQSNRLSSYLQNAWAFDTKKGEFTMIAGVRAQYWTVNKQFFATPRLLFSFKPDWKRDFIFRLSTGLYYQPPFYREMRDFKGNLNTNLKAQESFQILGGMDYEFKSWSRPFKLTAEVFQKSLDKIVPYEIDNVRIRYFAKNNAVGYARGIDFKINGEFVRSVESWLSVSYMKTEEDVVDDYYYTYKNKDGDIIIKGLTIDDVPVDSTKHTPGYVPRPSDQRISVNLFFQDYLPIDSTFKMHLNLVFGSAMRYGPPNNNRYADTLKMPTYRRVDIGFSKQLKSEKKELPKSSPFHYFKSIWASVEVFNLLQINNTISYLWIKDITNRQYSVPSYLTPRMLNIRIIAKF
ncbi:MAG: carboxypeptidase-like regulatory domain-containing protein [Bacteroidota bacterium]